MHMYMKYITSRKVFTSLEGTTIGVPGLIIPATTVTPTMIGLRALNTQLGSIFNLQGNVAMCSFSLLFLSFSSYAKVTNNYNYYSTCIKMK